METFFILFFSILLVIVTCLPFYITKLKLNIKKKTEDEDLIELKSLRNIEFENLQDLKIDLELKKITEGEFYELSLPIIKELEQIDLKLNHFNSSNNIKSEEKPIFCYSCGLKLESNNIESCPSCKVDLSFILKALRKS